MPVTGDKCVHGHDRMVTSSGRKYCPQCNKKYINENKDLIKQYKKEWSSNNKDKNRASYHRTKHRHSDRVKKWRLENADSIKKKNKEYKDNLHPLFKTWLNINNRCYTPGNPSYSYYGEQGVEVYEPWRLLRGNRCKSVIEENAKRFNRFKEYMETHVPPRQEGQSIDRFPNYRGNYEPNNLRWASPKEQSCNRAITPFNRVGISENCEILVNGTAITLKQISDSTGINLDVVKDRYARYGSYDLIINKRILPMRKYFYKGAFYSFYELVILSKIPRTTLKERLKRYGWSLERALETPVLTSRR